MPAEHPEDPLEYFFKVENKHGHELGQVYIPHELASAMLKIWKEVVSFSQLNDVDVSRVSLVAWDTETGLKKTLDLLG